MTRNSWHHRLAELVLSIDHPIARGRKIEFFGVIQGIPYRQPEKFLILGFLKIWKNFF